MREAKRAGFEALKRDYAALKASWGGFAGYDRIIGTSPGNALLASITAYSKFVPGCEKMIEAEGGDLPRFNADRKSTRLKSSDPGRSYAVVGCEENRKTICV